MYNNSPPSQSSIKKQQFRKQIRKQYLTQYMHKIRTNILDSQQFTSLLTLINNISQHPSDIIPPTDLNKLIQFANSNQTYAIVYLSILINNKLIQPESIVNQQYNEQNQKVNFQTSQNQGWLVFIWSCVNMNFCTEKMIIYCIKAIVKSKSDISIDFALQSICLLLTNKRIFNIQQIIQLIVDYDNKLKQPNQNCLVQQFFYSLLKLSSNQCLFTQNTKIKQCSIKLLQLCLQNEQITEEIFLKIIPLSRLSAYFKNKLFDSEQKYRIKSIKMFINVLMSLSKSKQINSIIINQFKEPLQDIMRQLYTNSLNLLNDKNVERGYYHQVMHDLSNFQLKFIQEGIYLIEVLVDDYMCVNIEVEFLLEMFAQLSIDQILINFHHLLTKSQPFNCQNQNDQPQIILSRQIQKIVEKIIHEFLVFTELKYQFTKQASSLENLKKIFFSRIKNSTLKFLFLNFNQLKSQIEIEI